MLSICRAYFHLTIALLPVCTSCASSSPSASLASYGNKGLPFKNYTGHSTNYNLTTERPNRLLAHQSTEGSSTLQTAAAPEVTPNACASEWLSYLPSFLDWDNNVNRPWKSSKWSIWDTQDASCSSLPSVTTVVTSTSTHYPANTYTICPGESYRTDLLTDLVPETTTSIVTETRLPNCEGSKDGVEAQLGPSPTAPPGPVCTIQEDDCASQFSILSRYSITKGGNATLNAASAMMVHAASAPCTRHLDSMICTADLYNTELAEERSSLHHGLFTLLDPNRAGFSAWNPSYCSVTIRNFALVHFPPQISSRNICANSGWGTYSTIAPDPNVEVTANLKEISLSDYDAKTVYTMTGNWNFTSPSVYLAFTSAVRKQLCKEDQIISEGVITLRPEELETVHPDVRYVTSLPDVAKNQTWVVFPSSGQPDFVNSHKQFHLPDLTRPYPAKVVSYDYGCLSSAGAPSAELSCPEIDFGAPLTPKIIIPVSFISQFAPSWSNCYPFINNMGKLEARVAPVWDPPVTLTGSISMRATPTLPSVADPLSDISSISPGATPSVGSAIATREFEASTMIPQQGRPPIPAQPRGEGFEFLGNGAVFTAQIPTPSSTPTLSSKATSGRPNDHIVGVGSAALSTLVISGNTLSVRGPAASINGHRVSLATNGLVIDGLLARPTPLGSASASNPDLQSGSRDGNAADASETSTPLRGTSSGPRKSNEATAATHERITLTILTLLLWILIGGST